MQVLRNKLKKLGRMTKEDREEVSQSNWLEWVEKSSNSQSRAVHIVCHLRRPDRAYFPLHPVRFLCLQAIQFDMYCIQLSTSAWGVHSGTSDAKYTSQCWAIQRALNQVRGNKKWLFKINYENLVQPPESLPNVIRKFQKFCIVRGCVCNKHYSIPVLLFFLTSVDVFTELHTNMSACTCTHKRAL